MSESHEYRVWAPHAERMRVVAGDESVEMAREEGGWWHAVAPAGDYGFQVGDDDAVLPDPRSLRQPHGVHERSRVWDASDHDWDDLLSIGEQHLLSVSRILLAKPAFVFLDRPGRARSAGSVASGAV